MSILLSLNHPGFRPCDTKKYPIERSLLYGIQFKYIEDGSHVPPACIMNILDQIHPTVTKFYFYKGKQNN